ncbi:MAG: hypothetical protein R2844_10390 [Caldilineales bacterium]
MKPVYEAWRKPQENVTAVSGLPRALRIREIRAENARTNTLVLDGALDASPGQFVMAWLPGRDERPFSLADSDPVRLTIAAVGPFSHEIGRLRIGDRLWLRGPLGRGYRMPVRPSHALLIGGGYGVAPLKFLAQRLLADGHAVSMIIGARAADDLLLVDSVARLGVRLWTTTEDGSAGLQGLVTDAMIPALTEAGDHNTTVYACGPTGMLRALAVLCSRQQVPFQLSWEAHMRCGIGLCGSCEVGAGWLTCLDGPVFDFNPLERASWDRTP